MRPDSYSGSAFETGAAFNLYGYNSRSEVTSGNRYWGSDVNSTNDPVAAQSYGYQYDNIGNRETATRNARQESYTANNLDQYTQRTIPGYADIIGSATTGATVTVNILAVDRHGEYWRKELAVTNTSSAVFQPVTVREKLGTRLNIQQLP